MLNPYNFLNLGLSPDRRLPEALKEALKAGVHIDSVDTRGWTYLMNICRYTSPPIDLKSDFYEFRNGLKVSLPLQAFHHAYSLHHSENYEYNKHIIMLLIKNGANVNYQATLSEADYKIHNNHEEPENLRDTPLTIAVLCDGNEDVLKILLDAGADPSIASERGTPLEIARAIRRSSGKTKNVEFLEKYIVRGKE